MVTQGGSECSAPNGARCFAASSREFLASIHQYEAIARKNLVSALARISEMYKYNVRMQADVRLSQRQRELLSQFSQRAKDWFKKHSNIEERLKKPELLSRLLDHKLIDFRRRTLTRSTA